jgi:hypothetical protein
MKKRIFVLRMALGGAVSACLIGMIAGACLGVFYGLVVGDLTFGLDGALLGGVLACLPGALVGWLLGRTETREEMLSGERWIPREQWKSSESRVQPQ